MKDIYSVLKWIFPQTSLAINVKSISNFDINGKRLSVFDMMQLFKDTKILFYKGENPIVIKKGWFSSVKLIDINNCTEEEKEVLVKFFNEEAHDTQRNFSQ